jgi:hypothetical protein
VRMPEEAAPEVKVRPEVPPTPAVEPKRP